MSYDSDGSVERQFLIKPVRDIHEPVVAHCGFSLVSAIISKALCLLTAAVSIPGSSFALSKFMLFNHNICCVDLRTVPVSIGSCLDPANYDDFSPLPQMFFCKFACFSKGDTADEISILFTFLTSITSLPCKCRSGNGRRIFPL